MNLKSFATAGLAAVIVATGATRAQSDGGDIVGGIVGGIIGGAIVNESQKRRQPTVVYRKSSPSISSAQRAENREIQTSLNYFGFPAGTPDGILGRRSRSAVSQYQAHMGYPVTGHLSLYEKDFLISSYHRALSGGPTTSQLAATLPGGTRGLLVHYRDMAAGVVAPAPMPAPAPQAVEPPVMVVAPQPEPEPKETLGALPTFMGQGSTASLASHCNTVSLLTNSNGGFTTLAAMNDPDVVLDEQFCLARTYAIAEGEELVAQVQGVGPEEIAAQCRSFAPAMKDHVAALSLKPRDEVLRDVSGFALSSGMAPPQLAATARICLSVGYRTDEMDVAVGSALLLAALGEGAYAELLGHHLAKGFGATPRADLAGPWYEMSIEAVRRGKAVFAPGQPERTALIQAAVNQITGGGAPGTMTAPVQPAAALPSFTLEGK